MSKKIRAKFISIYIGLKEGFLNNDKYYRSKLD
jgi:hypothetical protein